ncbi:MAG: metal-dependent hydrolase [Leptolinea sp.]|jgi:L-ascorbate metabolism protein UlaG (beta-lactamase superfamily)|nr:metal-dependent hydrolase [Leptolinea sp.]
MAKVTWLGHAAFSLETEGKTILVDPFLTRNPLALISADKVEADYILITHGHGDHLGDALNIARRTGATIISNAEICDWLAAKGVKVHGQHLGGGFNHPFGYVKLTLALHGSALPDGSNGGNPAGFLITLKENGKKMYFAGDTGLFGDMRLIGEEGIDLAALPIGDNFTMGPADALRAVRLLQPGLVIPIHYNTFPVIRQDASLWAKEVEAETSTKVKVLSPGESIDL